MSLPIDPAAIDPEDFGEHEAILETDHQSAIERVRDTCADAGFGIPVEFSPSELLNKKVDADRDPYYVLGACNPRMADRALTATDKRLGALFPCNMVVWEQEPGRQVVYHISIMQIASLLDLPRDREEMDDIIGETGEMVAEVFAELEQA